MVTSTRTPVQPDDEPPSPNADAPIAEQEPLGSGETTDSPSDLIGAADRDPQLPIDADMPLDVMVERQGEAAPPAPPLRDERGMEVEDALADADGDDDEQDLIDPDSVEGDDVSDDDVVGIRHGEDAPDDDAA